ncbi:MAG: hypothetical protein FWC79_04615 [Oscillospiraceae bacterium]|nr:hypothetical protein [Oscillospiraceae bacterium]
MEEKVVGSGVQSGGIKNIAKVATTINGLISPYNLDMPERTEETIDFNGSEFRLCVPNLPAEISFWTKVKRALYFELKVELTPYQQKIENEINDFLNKRITFKMVKDFLFQEITFGKKK